MKWQQSEWIMKELSYLSYYPLYWIYRKRNFPPNAIPLSKHWHFTGKSAQKMFFYFIYLLVIMWHKKKLHNIHEQLYSNCVWILETPLTLTNTFFLTHTIVFVWLVWAALVQHSTCQYSGFWQILWIYK